MKFTDESEEWSTAFVAALTGVAMGLDAQGAEDASVTAEALADQAVMRLEERREAARVADERRRAAIEAASAKIRETGAYLITEAGDGGHVTRLYDVIRTDGDHVALHARGSADGDYVRLRMLDLLDAENLADEYGLVVVPAPPGPETEATVALLKIANFFGVRPSDVTLIWDGGSECEPPLPDLILDIELRGGVRPTRATWAQIESLGLPIVPYAAAQCSWC